MPWFRCFIRGGNFPGALIGEAGPVGFYVTRFVEADDPGQAEAKGLELLKADPHLKLPAGCDPTVESRVYFDEIEEITGPPTSPVAPGFAWFPQD
ncbi:MAG TPA: hypothetical protein VKE40_25150 [Gemmataceae bacterium]|nr:hypothetical protein [Gemmataceae bacterium]